MKSYTIKSQKIEVEAILRSELSICGPQYGFMPMKSSIPNFNSKMFLDKNRYGQKKLHCAFVDLKRVYDRKQREELWFLCGSSE